MKPYTDIELLQLLDDIETDSAERKESFSDGDKARQAVCAFANDLPNQNKPFDLYSISDADIHELSRNVFENEYLPMAVAPDVLEANDRTYEEKLASCRMIVSPRDTTPTVLGLLFIALQAVCYEVSGIFEVFMCTWIG